MNISVITGSRADYGHLQWLLKCMREDEFFGVAEIRIWGHSAAQALHAMDKYLADAKPDLVLLLGDRFEIMAAAMAAHLHRIPIAHLAGGDVTEGSYDDAMRDCISRMAKYHFLTNYDALRRLERQLGQWTPGDCAGTDDYWLPNAHVVGSTAHDYILKAPWKKDRPYSEPYVVVSYQAETIDGVVDLEAVYAAIGDRKAVFLLPNPDRGSATITAGIRAYADEIRDTVVLDVLPHDEFLTLLAHCEEFIGNSSAILYEAPLIGCKTRLIGKRQRGRVSPSRGDGRASERIIDILKKEFAHGPQGA